MIGCSQKVRRTALRDEAAYWDLEGTAPSNGAPQRDAPDGVSKFWCPDWTAAINESTNVAVVDAVVDKLIASEPAGEHMICCISISCD